MERYSLKAEKVIEDLIQRKVVADKVMIFSDSPLWEMPYICVALRKAWHQYKTQIAPKAKLYVFTFYQISTFPISRLQKEVFLIKGWHEKIFDILVAIENEISALAEIKKIKI